MKKVNGFLVSFMMTIAVIGFTSCDNDYYDGYYDGNYYGDHYRNNSANLPTAVQMSNVLRGTWRGQTKVKYKENGQTLTDILNTEITFRQAKSNATYGEGTQIDYQNNSVVSSRSFTWNIDYATLDIVISYKKENGNVFTMRIDYDDLQLNNRTFSGEMEGYNEADEFDYRRYGYSRILKMIK